MMFMYDLGMLKKARKLVRAGYQPSNFSELLGVPEDEAERIYNVALAQVRYGDKFSRPYVLDINSGRLATHELVADYHARRLKTNKIVDLGCGVGIQLISFARYSRFALGVELDKDRVDMAKQNIEIAGVNNAQVINADIFSKEVKDKLGDFDIAFSDPARPYSVDVRTLDSCKPDPRQVLKFYSDVGIDFAFDIPPQIRRERVDIEMKKEFEYISLRGSLNRLTLYLGDLAEVDRSVVVLPGGHRLMFDSSLARDVQESKPKKYLYDVDGAVVASGLIPELQDITGTALVFKDSRRVVLTSDNEVDSPFFRSRYLLLATGNLNDIIRAMKSENMGKAVLRFSVPPHKYYEKKHNIEKELKGNRTGFIFKFSSAYALAMKL